MEWVVGKPEQRDSSKSREGKKLEKGKEITNREVAKKKARKEKIKENDKQRWRGEERKKGR